MIHFDEKACFICGSRKNVEVHHIFGASNRTKSDKDGLTVYLCSDCHREASHAAHRDANTAQLLHAVGELMWMVKHPNADKVDFMLRYGRKYLRDWREWD